MAVTEGLLVLVLATILNGILPSGMFAESASPQSPSPAVIKNPLSPSVMPRPARPGVVTPGATANGDQARRSSGGALSS
jgi:hypothetical protein